MASCACVRGRSIRNFSSSTAPPRHSLLAFRLVGAAARDHDVGSSRDAGIDGGDPPPAVHEGQRSAPHRVGGGA
eukprot:9504022-Pyramimonas_sp.AAC.1